MTALHLGVRSADEDTVKTLASKADPSAINAIDSVNNKYFTALHFYLRMLYFSTGIPL